MLELLHGGDICVQPGPRNGVTPRQDPSFPAVIGDLIMPGHELCMLEIGLQHEQHVAMKHLHSPLGFRRKSFIAVRRRWKAKDFCHFDFKSLIGAVRPLRVDEERAPIRAVKQSHMIWAHIESRKVWCACEGLARSHAGIEGVKAARKVAMQKEGAENALQPLIEIAGPTQVAELRQCLNRQFRPTTAGAPASLSIHTDLHERNQLMSAAVMSIRET